MPTKTKRPSVVARAKKVATRAHERAKTYIANRPHRSFKRSTKKLPLGGTPFTSVRQLLADVWRFIKAEKRPLASIGLLFAVVNYFVVGGVSQVDFLGLKEATQQLSRGDFSGLETAAALFVASVSGAVTAPETEVQQLLAGMIAFIFWLAIIWFVRMRSAGHAVKVRDALYNCCSPLIPGFLVMLIVVVQLLPAIFGIYVLSIAQAEGWVQGGAELMMFSAGAALLVLLSGYWASSSLVALVAVTLPQTYPWAALSAASQLVIGQRWKLMLRVAVGLAVIVAVWVVVLLPTLLLDNWLKFDWLPLVPLVVQCIMAATLVGASVYMYKLYRQLL